VGTDADTGAPAVSGGGVRLKHPELLLEQLRHQAHELQRMLDRLYIAEQGGHAAQKERAATSAEVGELQQAVERLERAREGQRGVNELRMDETNALTKRQLVLEQGLAVAAERVEAVAGLYAQAMGAVHAERQAREKQQPQWWAQNTSGAGGGTGGGSPLTLEGYRNMVHDGVLTAPDGGESDMDHVSSGAAPNLPASSHGTFSLVAAEPEPEPEPESEAQLVAAGPSMAWSVDGGAQASSVPGILRSGEQDRMIAFPPSFNRLLTAAYLRRERSVELRPPAAASLWEGSPSADGSEVSAAQTASVTVPPPGTHLWPAAL
jgi:hypothetical protein